MTVCHLKHSVRKRAYLDCDDLLLAEAVTNLLQRQRAQCAQLQAQHQGRNYRSLTAKLVLFPIRFLLLMRAPDVIMLLVMQSASCQCAEPGAVLLK